MSRLAAAWLVAVAAAGAYLWLAGGWFHIELLPVSEHVRTRGLLTVFDWSVFDVNPTRLRPLSDLTEVIDALLRPRTAWLFGYHPSFSLSGILLSALCAWFFHGAMRSMGLSRTEALMVTALFVSTIAYLSCFVPYIRPAKRLAMLALCALLYLMFRFIQTKSDRILAYIFGVLFLSFFADEAGFVYWPVALLFLAPSLGRARLAAYLAIPVAYLVLAKGVLPPIYSLLGKSGPRDRVIASEMVMERLQSFLAPDFYVGAIENLGRTAAASFGTLSTPVFIPVALILAIAAYALAKRNAAVLAGSLSVIGASFFFSMLDTVNTTPNYIGQWTYYYHTSVAVLAIVLAAATYQWLRPSSIGWRMAVGFSAVAISVLNLINFSHVNEVVRIIHTYPLARLHPRQFDPEGLAARFETLLHTRSMPYAEAFRRQFAHYRQNPMGDASYADKLEQTYKKRRR